MSGTGDDGRVDGATTRRTVLRAGAGASLGLLSPWAHGVAVAQGAAEPHVRREIHGLAPEGPEIAALRRGIAAMKARPATDPTSWLFQANIHGTDDDVPARFASVWNSCQHGSHFFLSWHRLYLYFFERILRAASGSSTFALPYWDYSVAARRRLPAVFRDPASAANPLYVSDRRRSVNAGEPLPASATSAAQAMATIPFASPPGSGASFGGQALDEAAHFTGPHGRLESQPHDVMHVALGGNGWMSDPNLAARDPIFWLHHCNIDRLWTRWLALGGGRRNPGSGPWTTTRFTFFDERGREVTMTGSDVIEHERQLGYRYDDGPSPRPSPAGEGPGATEAAVRPPRVLAAFQPATEAALALGTRDTTVALQPTADRAVESAVEAAAAPTAGASAIELSFDDIARRPLVGLYYEVYLNKPADAPFDADGPYFAGTLAFFADGHAHGAAGRLTGLRKALPVGSVLAAQRSGGRWSGGEVRVELHPVGAEDATEAAGAPLVTVGRIQLIQP